MKMFWKVVVYLHFTFVFTLSLSAQNISQHLVGTNVWYLNPSNQVWDLTAECGVKTIRIGGHSYDKNMPSKTTLLNWVKKIQAMGAEPIIQVSQYQSAEVAAGLVKYFNIDMKDEIAPVKYWSIGNEPWLQNDRPSLTTVGAMVEAYFKPRAEAMKEIDPTIKIYGPDFCYYIDQAINDLFGGKNDISGKIPGKDYYYCDGISWHRYPQDENINLAYGGIEDFRGSIVKSKQKVDAVNALHNRTGENALIWGIGEFNAKGGPEVHTWENGQMFGGILGLCMKYEAKFAASWSMFENGGNRQGTDFSFIDGANMTPRASYRHMEFVAKFFKGEYVDGTASGNDFVVYGARNDEQTAVMIMHRADGDLKEYTLHLNDTATTAENHLLRLNAGQNKTYNDIISPRTTHVILFRKDSVIKINYSSDHFDKELPPDYSEFELAAALPDSPFGLQYKAVSHEAVEIMWNDNSENEQGFIIENEEAEGFQIAAVVAPNTTSYTIANLTPETEYRFRIKAYNRMGKSDPSDTILAVTLEAPAAKAFNGPHAFPGKVEAEDFNDNGAGMGYFDSDQENQGGKYRTTGVDIESTTDAGGGFNIGYITQDEWLAYLIEDVTPGTYDMAFRTASNASGTKRIDVFLNDIQAGSVIPNNTGGWQNWETLYMEDIEIKHSDPVLVTVKFTGQEYNLNWFEVGQDLVTTGTANFPDNNLQAYFNGQNHSIILVSGQEIAKAVVTITDMEGRTFKQSVQRNLKRAEINSSGWPKGLYLVNVTDNRRNHVSKILIY